MSVTSDDRPVRCQIVDILISVYVPEVCSLSTFAATREQLLAMYQPLVEEVVRLDEGLRGLAEKNTRLLLEQVSFLEERLVRSLQEQEDVEYLRVKRIEASLLPDSGLQERKLSIFPYANKYGLSLVDRLVESPFVHDGTHQIFYV